MVPKKFLKYLPYLVGLFFTIAIYKIHMLPTMDSMLNENNTITSNIFLASQINYHKEIAPFARRPITTYIIETTANAFDIKLGYSFILVNFLLLFLSSILLYVLSKKLGARPIHALMNMAVYFSSFSVLFIFFPPVFSYDEPMQYCFIFLAFIGFVQRKWVYYILFCTLALITRETTIILIPCLLLFLPGLKASTEIKISRQHIKTYGIILLPIFFYGIFIVAFLWNQELWEPTKAELSSRFTCFLENFESQKNTTESVVSIFLTIGPFLYLTAIYLKRSIRPKFEQKYINAFLLALVINTPLVLLTAFARESRLFALPLFFIWPVFGQFFGKEVFLLFSFKLYVPALKKVQYLLSFLAFNVLNYLFCFEIYEKMGLGENNYYTEYLFMVLLLISIHFLLYNFLQKHPEFEKHTLNPSNPFRLKRKS